jgi:hypothetical protein
MNAAESELESKILRLERPDGWSGDGADGISRQACEAASDFAINAMTAVPGLGVPRFGPSFSGAVGLQWDLGDRAFVVRVPSANPGLFRFREEGPAFHNVRAEATPDVVLDRISRLATLHS